MSSNDFEDQDDEPVNERQACPMGIPMKLLEKMSPEDIEEWLNWDPATDAQKAKRPEGSPDT